VSHSQCPQHSREHLTQYDPSQAEIYSQGGSELAQLENVGARSKIRNERKISPPVFCCFHGILHETHQFLRRSTDKQLSAYPISLTLPTSVLLRSSDAASATRCFFTASLPPFAPKHMSILSPTTTVVIQQSYCYPALSKICSILPISPKAR